MYTFFCRGHPAQIGHLKDVFLRSCLLAVSVLVMSGPCWGAVVLEAVPALSPGVVVEILLTALHAYDAPSSDAGIAQTWAFALA
jgi:hypothetical protein